MPLHFTLNTLNTSSIPEFPEAPRRRYLIQLTGTMGVGVKPIRMNDNVTQPSIEQWSTLVDASAQRQTSEASQGSHE